MAVRLPVILIQSRPPHAAAEKLADSLVGELIGAAGLDLILVDPVAEMETGAIDRLTLESLEGDVALLDWKDSSEIIRDWRDAGLVGERAPHDLDSKAVVGVAGVRRVYAIDLRVAQSYREVLTALGKIQSERMVKTFSLGLPLAGGPKAAREPSFNGSDSPPIAEQGGASLAGPSQDNQKESVSFELEKPSSGPKASELEKIRGAKSENKLDLDALMDEFDRSEP
ncbi:MAG: hypothetical protein VXZ38_06550 [Planctomycetota bacterium]|nr:hypothetical protein [Planctomycetota bacterium]